MARTPIIGQSQQNRAPREIMVVFEKLERVADATQSLASAVNAVKIADEVGNRIRNRLVFSTLGARAGAGPGHPPTPVTMVNFCSARRQGWIDAMVDYVTRGYPKATPGTTSSRTWALRSIARSTTNIHCRTNRCAMRCAILPWQNAPTTTAVKTRPAPRSAITRAEVCAVLDSRTCNGAPDRGGRRLRFPHESSRSINTLRTD